MRYILSALLLLATANSAQAMGGIYLGTTRIVFDSADKTTIVTANNSSQTDTWLLRSWVSPYVTKGGASQADANKKTPFIVTPPLYRLDAKGSVQLRINRTKGTLPDDRESVFYFNTLAIPPKPKDVKGSMVQFALNTQIKLFYRPHALNDERSVAHAYKHLTIEGNGSQITLSNPTPYYLTAINISVNNSGLSFADPMLPPFGKISTASSVQHGTLTYQTINDYGGQTPKVSKTF